MQINLQLIVLLCLSILVFGLVFLTTFELCLLFILFYLFVGPVFEFVFVIEDILLLLVGLYYLLLNFCVGDLNILFLVALDFF